MISENHTPTDNYVLGAFRKDQRRAGNLPCDEQGFLQSVYAEILLVDPSLNLDELKDIIEAALKRDSESRALGQPATAFRNLPQRQVLKDGIYRALCDARLKRNKKELELESVSDSLLPTDKGTGWVDREIEAENAAELARWARDIEAAIKRMPVRDRAILQLKYFSPSGMTGVQIAKTLTISEATVSKSLYSLACKLRSTVKPPKI